MKQPDACIVRITDTQGETQGTGFLVSTDGLIVTCAHVVEETKPRVAFPGGEPRPAQVVATDQVHDVAMLQLEGELPDEAEPVRLGRSSGAYDCGFRSRGYRPLGGLEGIPAKGEVLDAVSEAPGYPGVRYIPLMLQIQHVRGGMSGAPVYVPDLDLVVGMITSYWDSLAYWKELEERGEAGTPFPDRDTALATPAEAIVALCPDIRLWEPPPEFARPPFGVPFQAPAVPRYFVPRPEVSNELKSHLLPDKPIAPGALVVSAVHGLGGIGKTTLVAALAHDRDLQVRFPDGILWATLGHQPEILSRLHEWIQAMGDYHFHPTTADGASARLHTLLHDKACLLVVDDAWQADHVRPFLVGGERCRVLITTRDATLARKVGAHLYDLDVMTEAQALALFEARLGLLDGNRDQAAVLASELGYLPLALELAAAQVEAGYSWAELLQTFRQELADLAALDLDVATYRNESLRFSFRLSLERLSPDDQEAFAWLGVLPEDAHLNPVMAATLWDNPEPDVRKRLRRLRDRALLKEVGEDQYTVHDLLHDEAKLRLTERMPLPEAHGALLERYRKGIHNDLWHTLLDDGYIHTYLTWHMEQAKQVEAIHTLLRLETEEGRNAWYEAREDLGQTAGFLEDVSRAWSTAQRQDADAAQADALTSCIGLEIRCALCHASIQSLVGHVSPDLIVALVQEGLWTSARGIAYARLLPKRDLYAEALVGLALHLPEEERVAVMEEALAAAQELPEKSTLGRSSRPEALVRLAPYLPERLLHEALSVARAIGGESERAEVLVRLAPYLPEGLLAEAIAAARMIERDVARAEAMVGLARYLPDEKCVAILSEAIFATELSLDGQMKGPIELSGLWSYVPESERAGVMGKVLTQVRKLSKRFIISSPQAKALVRLAPYLPEELLGEALKMARELPGSPEYVFQIQQRSPRLETLVGLAPHLPEELLGETLVMAQELPGVDLLGGSQRADALVELAPHLPEGLLKKALEMARELPEASASGRNPRTEALVRLAPYLPQEERVVVLKAALEAALAVDDVDKRVKTMVELVPYLSSGLLAEALSEIRAMKQRWIPVETLTIAEALRYVYGQVDALIELVPYLPDGLLVEALAAVQGLPSVNLVGRNPKAEALVGLSPHLPQGLVEKAVEMAWELPETGWVGENPRAEALVKLAPYLPQDKRAEVLEVVLAESQAIENVNHKVGILATLAPHLPQEKRAAVLEETLAVARELPEKGLLGGSPRAEALTRLAPCAPQETLREILEAVQAIPDASEQAKTLADLAPHLPPVLLTEALTMARAIEDADCRVEVLVELAVYLPEEECVMVMRELLEMEPAVLETCVQTEAFSKLAGHIPLDTLPEALAKARAMTQGWLRAEALAALAPHIPGREHTVVLQEALAEAREVEYENERRKSLAGLASPLAKLERSRLYPLWSETLHILSHCTRPDFLSSLAALAPIIHKLGGEEAITETFRAIQDVGRWWP